MRLFTGIVLTVLLFSACNGNDTPDVSGVSVNLKVRRFEQDFFTADTTKMTAEIMRLNSAYPTFMPVFMVSVLGADPKWSDDTTALYAKQFIGSYKSIYDSAAQRFKDFSVYAKATVRALQYLKHYFPAYKAPEEIITYVGPLDGYGDILSQNAFFVGLHRHLGKDVSFYKNELVQQTYPAYISAHFEPDMIPVSCMELVTNDMVKDANDDMSLVQQMVLEGKKLYILSRLLPDAKDYQLIGYSDKQVADCYAHEAQIWDLFVQNSYLQTTDKNIIKNYIGKSPKTQELGEGAPGNIGAFAGWQIVKKYMAGHSGTSLQQLLEKDPDTIFQEAKYKP